jgi:predicted PurR-regulated permease PerM
LIAGVELAGFVGVILSIPISVLIVEFLDDKKRRDSLIEEETV